MSTPTTPVNTSSPVRRLLPFVLIVASVGFFLKSLVLAPVYIRFVSDVMYTDAWWVNILYYLTEGGLLDLAVFALVYPTTLYAVFFAGAKKSMRIILPFIGLTGAKFLLNFFMTSITDSALPDLDEFLQIDLPMIMVMLGLEWLQYGLVVLVGMLVRCLYHRRIEIAEGMRLLPASRRVDYPMPPAPLPFERMLVWRNPLQRGAFLVSLMMFIGRFAMHMVYQIALYDKFGSSDGWIFMLSDLLSDLVIAAVMYFVSMLCMMRIYRKETTTASPET